MSKRIRLYISDAVTQKEWEPAYKDSLFLAEQFHLMERDPNSGSAESGSHYIPTRERFFDGKPGWQACSAGDSEDNGGYVQLLSRVPEPSALPPADVFYSCIHPDSCGKRWKRLARRSRLLWDAQTEGDDYHICLLAIGIVLENHLPCKVTIDGDISPDDCEDAVIKAMEAMEAMPRAVRVSARYDLFFLRGRVSYMAFPNEDAEIAGFDDLYLGPKDRTYGAFLQDNFEPESLDRYWMARFRKAQAADPSSLGPLDDYFLQGFPIRALRRYLSFQGTDPKGIPLAESLAKRIYDLNHAPWSQDDVTERSVMRHTLTEELLSQLADCLDGICDVYSLDQCWPYI